MSNVRSSQHYHKHFQFFITCAYKMLTMKKMLILSLITSLIKNNHYHVVVVVGDLFLKNSIKPHLFILKDNTYKIMSPK